MVVDIAQCFEFTCLDACFVLLCLIFNSASWAALVAQYVVEHHA